MTAQHAFNFKRYLASREWALIKRQVRERSGGMCERCHFREAVEIHHQTYERIGRERLDDLQHVCRPCHKYESAVTDFNPAKCDCDPEKAQAWADLLVHEELALYEAALCHAREVLDAYA